MAPDYIDGPRFDSRLTITLRAAPGDRTELNLVHEHLDTLREAMPEVADQVEAGWAEVLDRLAQAMETRTP